MKAIRFHEHGGPEVLRYEDVPDPVPGPGQVLLRVLASGVNYADATRRTGGSSYPRPTPLPFTPGSEIVGVVENLGDGVTGIERGATVMAWLGQGGYAELAVADAADLLPVPAGVKPIEALSLIIQGLSAALILKGSARLQAGESVLIEGAAGGVGVLAVQLAKIYGAGRVIGAASTQAKRDLVVSLGADAAVDYTQQGWAADVKAKNGGRRRRCDPRDDRRRRLRAEPRLSRAVRPDGRVRQCQPPADEPQRAAALRAEPDRHRILSQRLHRRAIAKDRGSFAAKLLAELGGYVQRRPAASATRRQLQTRASGRRPSRHRRARHDRQNRVGPIGR